MDLKLNSKLVNAALWNNGYNVVKSARKATAMASNIDQYSVLKNNNTVDDFLSMTKLHQADYGMQIAVRTYLSDMGVATVSLADKESKSTKETTRCDEVESLRMTLGDAIFQRRSHRQFSHDKIDQKLLNTILQAANGLTAKATVKLGVDSEATLNLRTVSSGGGLYPVSIYLYANNVSGLDSAIYRYNPLYNVLIKQKDIELKEIQALCSISDDYINLSCANFVIFLAINFTRTVRKYGARGIRFAYHEAGAISQNIHLSATSLGLASVDCGSFYDDKVNNLLNLDGKLKQFAHGIILGKPA